MVDSKLVVGAMKTLTDPDEYLPLPWRDAAWVSYICTVCGCINGASVRGLFRVPSTHFTGYMIRTAISVAGGEESAGWLTNSGPGCSLGFLFSTMLGCGIGAFIAGLTLACKSEDGSHISIRLNHPNPQEWRWQHQSLLSACLLCLTIPSATTLSPLWQQPQPPHLSPARTYSAYHRLCPCARTPSTAATPACSQP
jgi:hypothetical protein